ncbi:MAG TPA: CPBP family intramembrane glutamic endopeptidase [Candidatus Lokiarchaeia archaeon]|nr:CPBP family intramembrane glutamic endopeptidase [Candidatus Lokiarchaeia archaeon]
MDLAPTESAYLAVMLLELAFLAAGIAILKGRKHSIRIAFVGLTEDANTPGKVAFNAALGVGVGIGLFFLANGIAIVAQAAVVAVAGATVYQAAQAGAVGVTPPSFSLAGLVLAITGQFLLVGLCEEFFFRGVLFRDLFPNRVKLGGVISAAVFGLYHVFPGIVPWSTFFVNFPYYFAVGLLLALFAWSRHFNLVANIVAHGTFNTIIFLLIFVI